MDGSYIQDKKNLKIRYDILVCLLLVIAILFSYYQVSGYEFVNYDDLRYVKKFEKEGLTLISIIESFTTMDASNWHPLTWLSHMVDVKLFGMNPGAHHMVNVFFHITNALLLFIVLRKMTGELWQSGFVAALFAIHPLHVESVAWVAERKDVLSTFFWMMTMYSYFRYIKHRGFYRYMQIILFFMLGLMSKPMLVTLPFVLLLLDYWPLCRFRFGQSYIDSNSHKSSHNLHLILEKIPLFILSAASCVMTILAQKAGGAVGSLGMYSLEARLANALVSYVLYIGKMFIPMNLAVFYPYPVLIPLWKIICALITLLSISFLVIKTYKVHPYFLVGWLWFIGTLIPVIGLVQVGRQAMADRYTYIPLIGLFIMVAWGFSAFYKKRKYNKPVIISISLVILLILTVITRSQVRYWANNFTLYEHAIDVTENNQVAHSNIGAALYLKGRVNEAIVHFIEALKIEPDYNEVLINLLVSLGVNDNIDQAIERLEKLSKVFPENSGLYYNLGVVYRQKGELDKAIKNYKKALLYHSEFAQAQFDLAFSYSIKGEYENALTSYKKTIKIQSDLFWAYYNIAAILSLQNKVDESISWLDRSIKKGFRNWNFLKNDKKMENIRGTSYYKSLLTN
jgi:tetratricopeptide (TPR) repeat protein